MMHKNVFRPVPFRQFGMIVSANRGTIEKNIPIFSLSAQGVQRAMGLCGRVDNEKCQDKQPT